MAVEGKIYNEQDNLAAVIAYDLTVLNGTIKCSKNTGGRCWIN